MKKYEKKYMNMIIFKFDEIVTMIITITKHERTYATATEIPKTILDANVRWMLVNNKQVLKKVLL